MKKIFVDTSAFVAIQDSKDINHKKALRFWKQIAQQAISVYTTNFIFDETYTLLLKRISKEAAIDFGIAIMESSLIQMVHIDEKLQAAAWNIAIEYQDKKFSFTDCTSFAVMNRYGINDAFAFDSHFTQMGFMLIS